MGKRVVKRRSMCIQNVFLYFKRFLLREGGGLMEMEEGIKGSKWYWKKI